jgi:glycosyltransferase involved in cell wall biosynthesis
MQRWAKWFADKGHEVHLITDTLAKIDNVKIHPVIKRGKMLNFLIRAWQTRRLVKKIKPDILHAHYVFGYGVFGAFTNYHPFVVSAWGSDVAVDPDKSFFHKLVITYTLKKADVVSAVNKSIKRRLRELNCNEDKILPLRIASVDTNKFHPSKRSESLMKSIGAANDFLVLSARWFKPIYHVDVFIKAIPYVLEKINNVKFVIIGSGSLEDKLKDLSKELKVEKNVLFVGEVCHDDMTEYFASADLYADTFVSVSAMEDESSIDENSGIGTATLEAMSCGVPVLLANKNNRDKYPYRTYYPLDELDLAKKIIEILRHKNSWKEIEKEARKFAIHTADQKIVMEKWEIFYFNLYNKYSG